jgi:3-oxoacyl-[acyl-carrier protein] reductase
MNLEYENRRVLIVGGSYGIGLASAKLAVAEGAKVAIASRSASNLEKAAAEIEAETGQRPLTIVADVTEDGAAQALADAISQEWGGLDVLISAVGGSIRSAFADLTDDQWMGNYVFNVLSTVRTIRAFLPLLGQGVDPAIVMLGAAASKMPYAHQVVTNVHKAGLLGLNKTLAAELAPVGIRVNLVAPGRTLTPLWTNRADKLATEESRTREDVLADFSKDIPLGRFGEAVEIARMVIWLASPCASYVTGQAVNVDGGIARGLL